MVVGIPGSILIVNHIKKPVFFSDADQRKSRFCEQIGRKQGSRWRCIYSIHHKQIYIYSHLYMYISMHIYEV